MYNIYNMYSLYQECKQFAAVMNILATRTNIIYMTRWLKSVPKNHDVDSQKRSNELCDIVIECEQILYQNVALFHIGSYIPLTRHIPLMAASEMCIFVIVGVT